VKTKGAIKNGQSRDTGRFYPLVGSTIFCGVVY